MQDHAFKLSNAEQERSTSGYVGAGGRERSKPAQTNGPATARVTGPLSAPCRGGGAPQKRSYFTRSIVKRPTVGTPTKL